MEDEALKQEKLTNELLVDMIKNQKNNMSNLFKAFIITICCYTCILIAMIIGFFVYESQYETFDTVNTEKTVTQEVSGEDSTINNVEGNQYNDEAVHNQTK